MSPLCTDGSPCSSRTQLTFCTTATITRLPPAKSGSGTRKRAPMILEGERLGIVSFRRLLICPTRLRVKFSFVQHHARVVCPAHSNHPQEHWLVTRQQREQRVYSWIVIPTGRRVVRLEIGTCREARLHTPLLCLTVSSYCDVSGNKCNLERSI